MAAAINSSVASTTLPSAATHAQTIPSKREKYSLNRGDIPTSRTLYIFQRCGFTPPTSTYQLTDDTIKAPGEVEFDDRAKIVIGIVTTIALIAIISLVFILPPSLIIVAPIAIGLCLALGSGMFSILHFTQIREDLFGKYDPSGACLRAQKELAAFIKGNGEKIREKLEQIRAISTSELEALTPTELRAAARTLSQPLGGQMKLTPSELREQISYIEKALEQLTRAETAVRDL